MIRGTTPKSQDQTLSLAENGFVECEYIRGINKVIDKLINAITALGGTV